MRICAPHSTIGHDKDESRGESRATFPRVERILHVQGCAIYPFTHTNIHASSTHPPPTKYETNFCLRHFLSYCASQTTNSSRGVVPLVPPILETTNTRVVRRSGTAFPRVEISKTINKREGQHRDDSATNGEGGYESIISIAGAIPRARV